jgi:hypothetical protein
MLGKAEGKHQVTEETEEQEGALPEDWRGEESGSPSSITVTYPLLLQGGATDDSQFAFHVVSHDTAYILDRFFDLFGITIR